MLILMPLRNCDFILGELKLVLLLVRTPFVHALGRSKEWCRGVVVKHADSQRRGFQSDSSMCHNKEAIGAEGNGNPPHKIHFPRKTQSPVFGFCYAGIRVCNAPGREGPLMVALKLKEKIE